MEPSGYPDAYDALDSIIAERDLWRWRSEEIVKMLEPNEHESECIHPSCRAKRDLHAVALEIMTQTPKGDG